MNSIIKKIKSEIPENVKIVAVTKGWQESQIRTLIKSGHKSFAESYVNEAEEKYKPLKIEFPDIKLHLIGNLQTNKVKRALQIFDVIETIDNFKIADKIACEDHMEKIFFIQVNIGNEVQKKGISILELEKLYDYCKNKLSLNIKGLMAIPPKNGIAKNYFTHLYNLTKSLNLVEISMGMSADYKEAIYCGATQVRLGRILKCD